MKLDNNSMEESFQNQLEEIISQLKKLEAEKDYICEEIHKILLEAKTVGLDKDILNEILKIHKVQREAPIPNDDIHQLYNHLLKWKNNKEGSACIP
ncbi:GapR family DNA-binding domain-containing protein [Candidatus Paracaedibacter symbiosus]|uniref:GapR family DNA-binding domain-containing protein n=1 Tax=Candidatus Paracaedibacter symbiosus TaxID=244582 RepID=UPI0009FF81C0|nr:GapR family DNA-binding domain-containing protein [Candidatus Paracaedibacter symbiosus]